MAGYELAPALAVLRAEINTRWPRRDKTSDGWIGDAAHQASKSDHNPNERGSVDALDVDEDGIDVAAVLAAIKRHPSARYVIYERRLYHRLRGWKSEPYTGVNPHDKHFHLSIDQTRAAEQDRRPWGLLEEDMGTLTGEQAEWLEKSAKLADQFLNPDLGMSVHGTPTALHQVLRHMGWALINGPKGSGAFVAGWMTTVAEQAGIDPAELEQITAAAREGAASAADELLGAVLAKLPAGSTLSRADVEQAVRDAFAGGLAPAPQEG